MHLRETPTVLWLSAHPEPRSLGGDLRGDGIAHLRALGHHVIESDLYAMAWEPVLSRRDGAPGAGQFRAAADTRRAFVEGGQQADVSREQEKVRAADALVIQFPLWWYGMPAILKGWFDRVFSSGFAFGTDPETGRTLRFERGRFTAKRALVLTTLGDRAASIGPRGLSGELEQLLFGLLHGTLAYTGMSVLRPWALPSADHLSDYAAARDSLLGRLDGLFADEPLAYRPQFGGDYVGRWELAPHLRPGETGLGIHCA